MVDGEVVVRDHGDQLDVAVVIVIGEEKELSARARLALLSRRTERRVYPAAVVLRWLDDADEEVRHELLHRPGGRAPVVVPRVGPLRSQMAVELVVAGAVVGGHGRVAGGRGGATRKTPQPPVRKLKRLTVRGGDGGNRTHVRNRAKDGVYERSRRSVSRLPLANAGGVAGGQPLSVSPDRLRQASRGEPAN